MKNLNELAVQLDNSVAHVIGSKNIEGFQKAYLVSVAMQELKEMLTPEYMKQVMTLQGSTLGFRTDKDTSGGYPESQVKNCLIEAVLFGLQPVGNQFNIIAGNMYPTKQGLNYLLKNTEGLSYEIIPNPPKITGDESLVAVNIKWTLNGKENDRTITIPIKVNKFMGADAIIGKAVRKASAWLFNTINGTEVVDGDIADVPQTKAVELTEEDIEEQMQIESEVLSCDTIEQLEALWKGLSSEYKAKYKLSVSNRKKSLTDGAD